MGFTHLPDKDPTMPKMERRVKKLVEPIGAKFLVPCNVQDDANLDHVFAVAKEQFGTIDFVLHSVAYAPIDDLKGLTVAQPRGLQGIDGDQRLQPAGDCESRLVEFSLRVAAS